MAGGLIPLEEARARLFAGVRATGTETVPLADAHGRTLAAPIVAMHDQPPAAMSAMDGYAIARADWPGPWHVVGEAAAARCTPSRPILSNSEAGYPPRQNRSQCRCRHWDRPTWWRRSAGRARHSRS